MTTVYIATPITGVPEQNLPMVREIAKALESMGFSPIVPHDIDAPDHPGECPEADTYPGVTGQEHGGLCYLKEDLRVMLECGMVVAAPGWSKSRGATVEVELAKKVGIPVRYWHPEPQAVMSVPVVSDDPRVAWR